MPPRLPSSLVISHSQPKACLGLIQRPLDCLLIESGAISHAAAAAATIAAATTVTTKHHTTSPPPLSSSSPQVVLRVEDEGELLQAEQRAKAAGLPTHIVIDAGRTQARGGGGEGGNCGRKCRTQARGASRDFPVSKTASLLLSAHRLRPTRAQC